MLPERGWDTYEATLRSVGERRGRPAEAQLPFLQALNLLDEGGDLTPLGERYFKAAFVHRNDSAVRDVLAEALLDYPPASAITQLLAGVPDADRETAETVLRNQGFGEELTDRKLGSLLALMNRAGVIAYSRSRVEVLLSTLAVSRLPRSIFISPDTPFGNKAWLRRVLRECKEYAWWFDKHFQHNAFEELWEALDGRHVTEVRILSLLLGDHDNKKVRRAYKDLRADLIKRDIQLEWRTINSSDVKGIHDRWIIGADVAWNVPNVNAIYSGQHSELSRSENGPELRGLYEGYWQLATPFE